MYSKSHLTLMSKQLEPLIFKSSLTSRAVLPAVARPYQQQQQSYYPSLPETQLWPSTASSSSQQQQQRQKKQKQQQKKLHIQPIVTTTITPKRHLHSALLPEECTELSSTSSYPSGSDTAPLLPSTKFLWKSLPSTPLHHYHIQQQQQYLSTIEPLPMHDFFAPSQKVKRPNYTFAHGASGFAKRRQHNRRRPYHLPQQHFYSEQMGEDAFFRRGDSFGISDGVGGWANSQQAADPALFARQLMHHAYLELERYDNADDPCFYHYDDVDPVQILQKSYEASLLDAEKEGIVGSCTACLAVLRHDELRIANLGDCGISVIRHNDYVFRSEEQQHSFNFPYQLGTGSTDQPKDAQAFNIKLEKNDIIIMGSDGLYDNLFDKDILAIIEAQLASCIIPAGADNRSKILQFEPQQLSDALADRARSVSDSKRNADSPFQRRAMHEGFYYQGGKADDICTIVAVVRDSEDMPDPHV